MKDKIPSNVFFEIVAGICLGAFFAIIFIKMALTVAGIN